MNIKDYILTNVEEETTIGEKKEKAKPVAEFSTILASGTDFIVEKKTVRSHTSLVIIASQKQFYIKNEKNGEIKLLTPELLNKFTDGVEIHVEGINWMDTIYPGLPASRSFCHFLTLANYFKDDVLYFDKGLIKSIEYYQAQIVRLLTDYGQTVMRIRKEFKDVSVRDFSDSLIYSRRYRDYNDATDEDRADYAINNISFLELVKSNYGVSGLDNFLHEFHEAADLVKFCGYHSGELMKEYEFKCESFIDYMIHESMRQGFVNDSIINTWYDTLNMQKAIYGKVVDKYPEHLDSLHTKLAYITRIRRKAYDRVKWEEAVEKALPLEHTNQFYCVTVPKTREELCDEATQQSNCVAGYFGKMVEGKCTILFLRKRKTPEKSWITIEVRDNAIVQAKMARNRELSPDAFAMLSQYAEVKDLKMQI